MLRAEANLQRYGRLSVWFEPNVGQMSDARFIAHGDRMNAKFQAGQMELSLQTVSAGTSKAGKHVVRFKYTSNADGTMAGEELQSGISNYIFGTNSSNWLTKVPHYNRLRYSQLSPGIDLVFYGTEGSIEHDYILHPGSDPRTIRMTIEGSRALSLSQQGDLVIKIPGGELRLRKPVAYQVISGSKTLVEARYQLSGTRLSFLVGEYDRSQELVIDPVLSYSTYLAGGRGETGQAIAVDDSGNAYVTGLTWSNDFPVKNAPQSTCNNCSSTPDVYVTKLNATGTDVVYSTFLGGSNYDESRSIDVDANGNAVVVGYTSSTDFPLKAAHTSLPAGSNHTHGFITSISPDGSTLNYSSYIGGIGDDHVFSVAVDRDGNAYSLGSTYSPDFPVTPGTFPAPAPAYPNTLVFIQKTSPAGALLISALIAPATPPANSWANAFYPKDIAVDTAANILIAGAATNGWPTTAGSFQPNFAGNVNSQNTNAFVAKINPAASAFVYSTYLGGNQVDDAKSIAVDAQGNAYVVGETDSTNFPVTPGSFLPALPTGVCCTGYLSKLNSSGSALAYSTYIAGTNIPFGEELNLFSVAVDDLGKAYATGYIKKMNFPLVSPLQSTMPADGNTVLAFVMNPQGSALTFSTYLSGTKGAIGLGAAVDKIGRFYLTGTTYDLDFPTTTGAFQRSVATPPPNTSAQHAFVSKIDLGSNAPGACFSPGSVTFSETPVGSSSVRTITLSNCGNAALHITSITTALPFSQANNCPSTLDAAATCAITVTFTPAAAGTFSGAVGIAGDFPTSPQKLLLSGVGAVPKIQVSGPGSFSDTPLGVTTFPGLVFIQNTGNAPLVFQNIAISGDFSQEGDCTVVQPFANCAILVRFTPVAVGLRAGALTLTVNVPGSPLVLPLSGNGTSSYPVPVLGDIGQHSVLKGTNSLTLFAFGDNFFPTSVIRVNGVAVPTTSNIAAQLSGTLDGTLFSQMRELSIDVINPGSAPSNSLKIVVYDRIAVTASTMAYDKFTRRFVATVPDTTAPNTSTLQTIDPANGSKTSVTLGKGANRLAISDDGRYAYVGLAGEGTVQRVDMESNIADLKVNMPSGVFGTQTAYNIKPIPGQSSSFAVSVFRPASPGEAGLAVFDGATLRGFLPNDYPNYTAVDSIGFAGSPATLYGAAGGNLWKFSLFPTPSVASKDASPIGLFVSDGTYLYDTSGRVFDPASNHQVGTYTGPQLYYAADVLPRSDAGRTYLLSDQGNSKVVQAYDQQTFKGVGKVAIDGQYSSAGQVVRWGSDGFAFTIYNYYGADHSKDGIILFRSSIASGNAGPNPLPTLTAVSPNVSPAVLHDLTLTLTGTNFVRGSIVRWNGIDLETGYVSDSTLLAYVSRADLLVPGTKTITVFNPAFAGGESAAIYFDLSGPAALLSSQSVDFGLQPLNATATRALTISNPGNATLAISSIGRLSGAFSQTNDCGTSLPAGGTCTINIAFRPTMGGRQMATLSIANNGPGAPHTVALAGTGDAPITLTLSRSTVDFGSQLVGATSAVQTVTLSSGNAYVTISSIAVEPEFPQTDNCGGSLAPNSSCTLSLKFVPSASGRRVGTLTVHDDSQGAPHTINLTGSGTDFTVSLNGSSSVTVSRGQPASYSLSLLGGTGFSGTVALSCSNLPAYASCTFSPASMNLQASPQSVTLSIATSASGTQSANRSSSPLAPFFALLVPALLLAGNPKRNRAALMLVMMVASGLLLTSCGGGGGGGTTIPPTSSTQLTAPGTYTVSIDARTGTAVRSKSVTLVVQ